MRYIQKASPVEAFQYNENTDETQEIPLWFIHACVDGLVFSNDKKDCIRTTKGIVEINHNDYIVKGASNELFVVTPEVFAANYTPRNETH